MVTPDQCVVPDEVFTTIGKREKIMYQISKTNIDNINRSYVKINFQIITSFLKELIPVVRLSCTIYISVILYPQKWLLGRDDIVENESVNYSELCGITCIS